MDSLELFQCSDVLFCYFLAHSPDRHAVATAEADEKLRIWTVFGTPEMAKRAPKANPEPFSDVCRIH